MADYTGNSKKDKEPKKVEESVEKKIEKVVEEPVKVRKRPLADRIKDTFFGGEFKSAASYIGAEVLLPALRNLLVDASSKGIERVVFGPERQPRPGPTNYGPRVTYNSPVNRAAIDPRRGHLPDQMARPRRAGGEEIILASRADAEAIIEQMSAVIERYDVVSRADLNEMAGIPSTYVDNAWGWTSIRFAGIKQVREGYLLELPPMIEI